MASNTDNVAIALALVVAAGASTALGAAVVFLPSIVKLASRRVLAGSLGFSAGVMTYVSFIEIFQKAVSSFEEEGHDSNEAYLYTTLSVFAGVLIMMVSFEVLMAYSEYGLAKKRIQRTVSSVLELLSL